MQLLYHLVDILSDGRYHIFSEIMAELRPKHSSEEGTEVAIAFLVEYGFAERIKQRRTRSRTWKVRLTQPMLKFLHRVADLENRELQENEAAITAKEMEP